MQKYYAAKEDTVGDYVTSNHVRYSVTAIDPSTVHIPAGREADMVLFDAIEDFLATMGLEAVADHVFPEPPAEPSPVPESLEHWRVKAALNLRTRAMREADPNAPDLVQAIDSFIGSLPDSVETVIARSAWTDKANVSRTSPTASVVQGFLGLTDAQVDDMFRLAATFNP